MYQNWFRIILHEDLKTWRKARQGQMVEDRQFPTVP